MAARRARRPPNGSPRIGRARAPDRRLRRRPPVHPQGRRDVRRCIHLCGSDMTEELSAQWVHDRFDPSLDHARSPKGAQRCDHVDPHDEGDAGQADHQRLVQLGVVRLTEDDQGPLRAEPMQRRHRHVADEEQGKCAQAEKVDAPGGLPSMKDSKIAREASRDRRRHGDAGRNAQRREQEDDACVRELLQGVVCARRLDNVQGGVAEQRVECGRNNLPGGRNQPVPLGSGKEHHQVHESRRQPSHICHEVPVASET